MTVFTRLLSAAAITASVVSLVGAHIQDGNENCANNEFWYEPKGLCLPYGGAANATLSVPPKDRSCPPAGFYWSYTLGCCVPSEPLSNAPNTPPPQCQVGWHWYPALHSCLPYTPDRTRTSNPSSHPSPSGVPSGVPGGNHRVKPRHHKRRTISLCPKGLDACPIEGALGGDYECLNVLNELESCGGCASIGKGQDCTAIKGAWNVGCEQGRCAVYSCTAGYIRSRDGSTCIPSKP